MYVLCRSAFLFCLEANLTAERPMDVNLEARKMKFRETVGEKSRCGRKCDFNDLLKRNLNGDLS
jgi:hypothetical protein